jgi:flavodoxin I
MKMVIATLFGYASGKNADSLKEKGGKLLSPAEGFIVKGREGPLLDGELERTAAWAKGLVGGKE